jgi:hypothetical protein
MNREMVTVDCNNYTEHICVNTLYEQTSEFFLVKSEVMPKNVASLKCEKMFKNYIIICD